MYKYFLSLHNEQGDWEDIDIESDNLRYMTIEARDLQRILPIDRKDSGVYYAVFKRGDGKNTVQYSAYGY